MVHWGSNRQGEQYGNLKMDDDKPSETIYLTVHMTDRKIKTWQV